MLFYCLKCREKADSKNLKAIKKRKNNSYIKLCDLWQ